MKERGTVRSKTVLSHEVLDEYEIPQLASLLERLDKIYEVTPTEGVSADYNLVEEVLIQKGYYNIRPSGEGQHGYRVF